MILFAGQVPFREELVDLSVGESPPYLENALVDWSLIFSSDDIQVLQSSTDGLRVSVDEYLSNRWPVSYFDELLRRRVHTTLDNTQLKSIQTFLNNRVTLIQGPPGTGKSYIGVKIAQLVLSMPDRPSGPILVLTYKNHALDQFLQDCLQFCSSVVRVGGRSTNEALQEKNIHQLKRKERIPEDLATQLRQTKRELDELKSTFPSAIKKLKQSRVFDVYKFVEVATITQISDLCDSCPMDVIESIQEYMKKARIIIRRIKDGNSSNKRLLTSSAESIVVLSTLLHAWAPKDDVFSQLPLSQKVPWNLSTRISGGGSSPDNDIDDNKDEGDSEETYEERLLSQDEVGLKGRHWRDAQQGYVSMVPDTRQTGSVFSLTVPEIPGYCLYRHIQAFTFLSLSMYCMYAVL
jgi:hypothetical protein